MAISDQIPKSRLTLTYRTEVSGEPEEKKLPFRLLVMGDLSLQESANTESKEKGTDLDQRSIRNLNGQNLNEVMKDLDIRLKMEVPNRIDSAGKNLELTLKLDSMKSFQPEQVAEQVTEVKALLLLKRLLLEVQGNLDNRKGFRQLIRELNEKQKSKESKPLIDAMLAQLKGFESYKVPARDGNGDKAKS